MTLGTWRQRDQPPAVPAMATRLGPDLERLWRDLTGWLLESYGLEGDPVWDGRESGWVLRFRLSGRSLTTLSPTVEDGFGALVVLGPSLWGPAEAAPLSEPTREILRAATAYADGRWLWLRVADEATADDVRTLVSLKAKPRRRIRRAVAANPGDPIATG